MKVYLASRYQDRDTTAQRRDELEAMRFVVTSRWLNERHSPNVQLADLPDSELLFVAMQDVEDIKRSDAFVVFEGQNARGGKHVELGMAYALGKTCVVVGARENVFHFLPDIFHAADWEAAKNYLLSQKYAREKRSILNPCASTALSY